MAKEKPQAVETSPKTNPLGKIKKDKCRSPNYPVVGLEEAVKLAEKMKNEYGTHPVPSKMLHKLWGFKEGGNTGNQCIAALKSYGLVDTQGEGEARKVSVSKVGHRIVEGAPDRDALIRQAAVSPKVHSEILKHYAGLGLPTTELLEQYLVWERPEGQRFNRAFVKDFIVRLRATLAFAGIDIADKMPPLGGVVVDPLSGDSDCPENPPAPTPKPRLERHKMVAGTKEDVFTLAEGDVILQWPSRISKASVQDFEDWLGLIVRKVKRAAEAEENREDDAEE